MLLTTILAAAALFQGPGTSTANVDDAASHGAIGDAHLSLDEAIQLANGTLTTSALSAAEQARLSGTGPLATIRIDAATTPTITLTAQLAELIGQGTPVTIEGLGSSRPALIGNGQPTILRLRRHGVTVLGLSFQGADVAIDAKMPTMTAPHVPRIRHCAFDGQAACGVRLRATGSDQTMLMLSDVSFDNAPLGVDVDDQTAGGRIMSEIERAHFDGVQTGVHASIDGTGLDTMISLFRSTFANGQTLCASTRAATSTKLFMYRLVYVDATCSGDVLDCAGIAAGTTMVHHHHGDWTAGQGMKAFWVHPRTGKFDVHGSEMTFRGAIDIAGNTGSPRFWHQNNHFIDCAIRYDVDGSLPNLLWNTYQNCSIEVPTTARSRVDVRQSELYDTDVASNSFLAPIKLTGCHRVNGTLQGFATETSPAPGRFLGTTAVTPREPQIGATVQLDSDLPFGIALVWDFAPCISRPFTSQEPVRFYGDVTQVIALPAVLLFQSSLTVPIPNTSSLVGTEWYVQAITLPLLPGTGAPNYHLPRGERITLR